MSANLQNRTPEQQAVINALTKKFDIDTEGIRFLNPSKKDEPWFPADVLMSIARQSDRFRGISVEFATFIEPLKQIVYITTVTDNNHRIFSRSGAAGLNERIPGGDEVEVEADAHALAASRSAVSALTAAGFNPMKAASAVPLDVRLPSSGQRRQDARQSQIDDYRTIHILAKEKGLIRKVGDGPNDPTDYLLFLEEQFGTKTSMVLNPEQRAALISMLRQLPDPEEAVEPERMAS